MIAKFRFLYILLILFPFSGRSQVSSSSAAVTIATTSSSNYQKAPSTSIYPAFVDGVAYQAWTNKGATSYFQLQATGGQAPYSWQITGGRLPAGLSLNKNGRISGTATKEGKATFTVKVTDAKGRSATKQLDMQASPYRSKWFADARFGIMIQWGAFVEPVLSLKSEIPAFEKRITAFNANQWAQAVADMGGKVLNFTVKAGDGIRLWPSKTPSKHELKTTRDIVGELITACHKRNIRFIAYIAPDHSWNKKVSDTAPDGSWGTLNKGIIQELLNMGVDGFWVDMGATPELYPGIDPKWFPWDEIIPLIRATNPYAIFANNPGLGNGGTILRWPNTDIAVYEGRMDVGEDALVVAKPTIVPKKIAIEVDNLLDKEWGWMTSRGIPGKPKPASMMIKNIRENWSVGATYMLNYPVPPDGNIWPEPYVKTLKEIGAFVKSGAKPTIASSRLARTKPIAYVPSKSARSVTDVKAASSASARKVANTSFRGMKVTIKGNDLVLEGIGRKAVGGSKGIHDVLIKRFSDDYPILLTTLNAASSRAQSNGYQYVATRGTKLLKGQTYLILAKEIEGSSFEASAIANAISNADLTISGPAVLNELGDRKLVKDDGVGQILDLKYTVVENQGPENVALGAQAALLANNDQPLKPVRNVMYASNAVDGDPATRAQAGGQYAWTLSLDFGKLHKAISSAKVLFAENSYATSFEILTSTDGKSWKKIFEKSGNKSLEVAMKFPATTAKYLKLRSIKPDGPNQEGGQMAVLELQVFTDK